MDLAVFTTVIILRRLDQLIFHPSFAGWDHIRRPISRHRGVEHIADSEALNGEAVDIPLAPTTLLEPGAIHKVHRLSRQPFLTRSSGTAASIYKRQLSVNWCSRDIFQYCAWNLSSRAATFFGVGRDNISIPPLYETRRLEMAWARQLSNMVFRL